MFKKSLLALLLTVSGMSVAYASGAYVGLGVGVDALHNKETSSTATLNPGGAADYGAFGAMGSFFAGFNMNFNSKVSVAVQPFFNVDSTQAKNSNTYIPSYSLTLRNNYGVQVLPGYRVLPDVTTHAILGYTRGSFQHKGGTKSNFNSNGYQLGLGADGDVAKNVVVRGDVVFSQYQSNTLTDTGVTFKSRPSTMDAILSVVYRYG